jgi:hypothetical protein
MLWRAKRRSRRSPPTVDPEGKRSLDVKGNALFPTSCRRSVTVTSRPLGFGYAADRSVEALVPRQATFARIEISRSVSLSLWRLRQAM